MSVPKQRRTSSHRKQRAVYFALGKTNYGKCKKCGRPILPHHACKFCGTYADKEVLNIKFKKGKPKKEKEEKTKEKK